MLLRAAMLGHVRLVELLVDRGADVRAVPVDGDGRAAQQVAALLGHSAVVACLQAVAPAKCDALAKVPKGVTIAEVVGAAVRSGRGACV